MKGPLAVVGALVALALLLSSVYTLGETEQAIVTQFGRPVGGVVSTAGLHLKLPLVQSLHRFEKRWLEYDGDPNEIPTRDKKYIWVDTYARWRIADARASIRFVLQADGTTDYEVLENESGLHIIRQPAPEAKEVGPGLRLRELIASWLMH